MTSGLYSIVQYSSFVYSTPLVCVHVPACVCAVCVFCNYNIDEVQLLYCCCSDIWFDDVDEVLIEPSKADSALKKDDPLVKPYSFDG